MAQVAIPIALRPCPKCGWDPLWDGRKLDHHQVKWQDPDDPNTPVALVGLVLWTCVACGYSPKT